MCNGLLLGLKQLRSAYEVGAGLDYGWKLFLLVPRMLLARPAHHTGPRKHEEPVGRVAAFQRRRQTACAKVRISEFANHIAFQTVWPLRAAKWVRSFRFRFPETTVL